MVCLRGETRAAVIAGDLSYEKGSPFLRRLVDVPGRSDWLCVQSETAVLQGKEGILLSLSCWICFSSAVRTVPTAQLICHVLVKQ